MQYDEQPQEYIPGTCNIGRQEIARRYRTAYVGIILSGLWIVLIEALNPQDTWRLTLLFPALLIFSGFLQAKHRFCLAYGWRGVFSVNEYRRMQKVTDPEFIRTDRRMAMTLTLKVFAGALITATVYYFLGRLVS